MSFVYEDTTLRVRWTIDHRPDGSYVTERLNSGATWTFGPMHRDTVGPFCDERAEMIRDAVRKSIEERFGHGNQ